MIVGLASYLLDAGRDYRSAGVSTYVFELTKHLNQLDSAHTFLSFQGSNAPIVPGSMPVRAPFSTRNPVIRIAWEQSGLPLEASRRRVEVLHGAVNVVPLIYAGKRVVTVHDLAFLRLPDRFHRTKVAYLKRVVKASVAMADHVIAVSEHTRAELIYLLSGQDDKISVVYSGVDSSFRVLTDAARSVRDSVFGGRPYILHVGTLEPRKNIDVLIQAFATVRRALCSDHVLALVGARGWLYQNLETLVGELGLEGHVRFLEYIDRADLPLWYNGADLFAYPSAYEGFGLPVVEAMACGVPTITSSAGALREVGGDACLVVEIGSVDALADGMHRILSDSRLRDTLHCAGLERSARFNWVFTAEQTVKIYERVAEGG